MLVILPQILNIPKPSYSKKYKAITNVLMIKHKNLLLPKNVIMTKYLPKNLSFTKLLNLAFLFLFSFIYF